MLDVSFRANEGLVQLRAPARPSWYYTLQASRDLATFYPLAIASGESEPTWELAIPTGPGSEFFRLRAVSIYAPEDTDGDGINDVYELAHEPLLSPLEPTDAAMDPDGDGRTLLEDYQTLFNYGIKVLQVFSREASVFNLGLSFADFDTISREVALFNFGSPPARVEAVSSEVSVFNGQVLPRSEFVQAFSREVSTYNFGSPVTRIEAVSREVGVYNGEEPPTSDISVEFSREISVFNLGLPTAPAEAISRELTILNFRDLSDP